MFSLGHCPLSLLLKQTNLQLQSVRGLRGKCLAWKIGMKPCQMNTTVCINESKTSKLPFQGPMAWSVCKNLHEWEGKKNVCGFDDKQQWANVTEKKRNQVKVPNTFQSCKPCIWPKTSEIRGAVSRYLGLPPRDSLSNRRSLQRIALTHICLGFVFKTWVAF